jgi:pyruvate dehydrogenase E2 component (dihydrolipoamide acetyltransferase)
MPFQLLLPDIGEGVVEAEVQKWLVAEGDEVAEDQPLVEVMTDKATVTIPSPRRGRILRLMWKEGEIAKVHAPLVEIDTGEETSSAKSSLSPAGGAGRGEGATTRRSSEPAAASGSSEKAAVAPSSHSTAGGEGREGTPVRKALATPAVRAMAREMGLAIDAVTGTGPGGRVTKDDLEAARGRRNGHAPAVSSTSTPTAPPISTEAPTADATPSSTVAPAPRPSQPAGAAGEGGAGASPIRAARPSLATQDERVPLRGLRRKIAENMARSKRTAAHFTFVEQCDVTELVHVKDRMAGAAREEGVKLTFLPFVLKAAALALRKHPRLNATMDEERGELVLHRRHDLGVAAATDAGLVVPVVRDVDGRSLVEVAREVERLSEASRAGRLRPEDVGRSTFTITSLGALGGLFATPVLNHPEVGILGIHRIRPTPVAREGQVAVRDVMHLSVTSDHRVIDGHEAAAFAYEVIRLLEEPNLLFMQMA